MLVGSSGGDPVGEPAGVEDADAWGSGVDCSGAADSGLAAPRDGSSESRLPTLGFAALAASAMAACTAALAELSSESCDRPI